MRTWLLGCVWLLVAGLSQAGEARHQMAPVSALVLEGKLPNFDEFAGGENHEFVDMGSAWRFSEIVGPEDFVQAEGADEIEAFIPRSNDRTRQWTWSDVYVVAKVSAGDTAQGKLRIRVRSRTKSRVLEIPFKFPADAHAERAGEWFAYARSQRLLMLASRENIGYVTETWLLREALKVPDEIKALRRLWPNPPASAPALKPGSTHEPTLTDNDALRRPTLLNGFRQRPADDPFAFVSGRNAVDQNLALDRDLATPANTPAKPDVPFVQMEGIKTPAIDWKPLLNGKEPKLDSFASHVPADQYALFFPNLQALAAVLEELESTGGGVTRVAEAVDLELAQRYRKQLGLPPGPWIKSIPQNLVGAIALTGSDPYFAMGTDLAVLLATNESKALRVALEALLLISAGKPLQRQQIAGVECSVAKSADGSVSAYLAEIPGAIILANSAVQIEAVQAAKSGAVPNLLGLDEYKFLRSRYPLGDPQESAFCILTDAAIRKWCGPRWRIVQSRRVQARAKLAEAQAEWIDSQLKETAAPAPRSIAGFGRLDFQPKFGANLEGWGTVRALRPIAELAADTATAAEVDAYNNWRRGYETGWRVFDPIAFRLTVAPTRLASDLSVMPLTLTSDYKRQMSFFGTGDLPGDAGDPHPNTLFQWIVGIRPPVNERERRDWQWDSFGPGLALTPWLGTWLTVYADHDPFWQDPIVRELITDGNNFNRVLPHLHRIPIGVAVGVRNPLALAGFLTAVRAMIDQSAPNLVRFQVQKHREVGYTRIAPVSQNLVGGNRELALYYLPLPNQLLISLNEKVIQRAIDRSIDGQKENKKADWLGKTLAFKADGAILPLIASMINNDIGLQLQQSAWTNARVLQEWKRRRNTSDPITLHQTWTGETLICPASGTFTWDPARKVLRSTNLGDPFDPKLELSNLNNILRRAKSIRAGFTLEEDNLRAAFELNR